MARRESERTLHEYACHARPARAIGAGGVSLVASSCRQVDTTFLGAPQFGTCWLCETRIARLHDRERWHHIDRAITTHEPIAAVVIKLPERGKAA